MQKFSVSPLVVKGFLLMAGWLLVALGILGMFLFGPTSSQSLLGKSFWLDDLENYAHLILGIISLGGYYLIADSHLQKWLVFFFGVLALVVSLTGFMNSGMPVPNLGITHKETAENILYLLVAVWAFYASFTGHKRKA